MKGKKRGGSLLAERKKRGEVQEVGEGERKKKGRGKDRKTHTTPPSLWPVYTRKFRRWDGGERLAREKRTSFKQKPLPLAPVFVPPPVIMKKLRLSRPLCVRVHTYARRQVYTALALSP